MKNYPNIPSKYLSNVYGCFAVNVGMENSIARLCETVLHDNDDCLKSKILPRIQSKLLQYNKSIKLLKSCYRDISEYEQNAMLDVFYNHVLPDIYGDKTIRKSEWDCDFDDLSLDLSNIERGLWNQLKEDIFNSVW